MTPGRVTHLTESCPRSVLDVLLDSSKASGGPVAHHTVLLPFFLYSSGTVIPGKVFFWLFQSLSEVSVALLISS